MEEKTVEPAESLQLIQHMINAAKHRLADDGFLFIFWGWLVFASAAIQYTTELMGIPFGYFVWPVLMPLGGIVSMVYSYRTKHKSKVRSHVDTYLAYTWLAFLVALFIDLFFIAYHGVKATYFFLMLLYGLATMISGGLLHFRPLVLGSLVSFAAAIASVFLDERELPVCIAVAILGSYIVPGHLLRVKFKSQHV